MKIAATAATTATATEENKKEEDTEKGSTVEVTRLELAEKRLNPPRGSSVGGSVAGLGSFVTRTGVAYGVGVPPSVGLLRGLQTLDLYGNGLVGPIPDSIGDLGMTLTRLNLGANKVSQR